MCLGDNLGVYLVNPVTVRAEQRSMTSTAWLMPSPSFWKDNEVLVSGPKGNYTVKDYKKFFDDIPYPTGYEMWQDTKDLTTLTPPGVPVYCFHGTDRDTPGGFMYNSSQWPDTQPTVINDKGDGTVNIRSLLGCTRWQKDKRTPVTHKEFPGIEHVAILKDNDVINAIKEALYN